MSILGRIWRRLRGFNSGHYWESRYSSGGNSGAGSYGRLAEFKAEVINRILKDNDSQTVVDWGVGDGNQLTMLNIPSYTGVDVSQTIVDRARDVWKSDVSKQFLHTSELPLKEAKDVSMSIDVIFHLVEDSVFNQYMKRLVNGSKKFVLVYSSNYSGTRVAGHHVFHRKFSDWMKSNAPNFKLKEHNKNRCPFDESDQDNTSFADFFLFEKLDGV